MARLSIVIPAYNEEDNVATVVKSVADVALRLSLDHEIIVVNDGSRDRTGEMVRELSGAVANLTLVEHHPNRGYGGALKAGFEAADGDLIAFIPADGQFDFAEIDRFLDRISSADLVCGYRALRQDNAVRRLNGWGWNLLVHLLFGYLSRDVDCGFKLLRRRVVERVPLPTEEAMIDTQLLAGARARGFRVAEVPVTHLPRKAGAATGANYRVVLLALRELLQFRLSLSGLRGRSLDWAAASVAGSMPDGRRSAADPRGGDGENAGKSTTGVNKW